MTAQEQLEYTVLSVFLNRQEYINSEDFCQLTKDTIGNGGISILVELEKRGLIESNSYRVGPNVDYYTERGYKISKAGRLYHQSLIKYESKDKKLYQIFVWTLIAAVIGAVAATLAIFLS